MNPKAIIFDFDGIITDTEPMHMEAWLSVLEPLGISFGDEEYREHYLGITDHDLLESVSKIHKRHFTDAQMADLIEDKIKASMQLLEHDIPLMPAAQDIIPELARRYRIAICSGAMRCEIEYILRHLGWTNIFNPIMASDSVKKGKPDPEGYIRTIEELVDKGRDLILPEQILAVEDAPRGIAAAKAAGLRCIAINNIYDRGELGGADWIFDSLADIDFEDLG